jgi:protein phosphatase 1 regulatory subunit 7
LISEVFETQVIGGLKYLFIHSDNIDQCLSFYRKNDLDVIVLNPYHNFTLNDLSFLNDHSYIKGLEISSSLSINDYSPLNNLKNLVYLSLLENKNPLNLAKFSLLRTFQGLWHPNLSITSECSSLRRLYLTNFNPKNKDLSSFPSLPNLLELSFTRSTINSLEGIQRFPKLHTLSLSYLLKLTTISTVNKLKSLEILDCDNCRKISDHQAIVKNKSLKILRYNSCGSIQNLRFLSQLANLEEFRFVGTNIVDGNLNFLLNLKRIGFLDKRHYSHTSDEIDALLAINRNEFNGAP